MNDCLVDVLNDRGTVLHVFPGIIDDQNGTPKVVDPERGALELAASMQLVSETGADALHARPHVSQGVPLTPCSDVLES